MFSKNSSHIYDRNESFYQFLLKKIYDLIFLKIYRHLQVVRVSIFQKIIRKIEVGVNKVILFYFLFLFFDIFFTEGCIFK